MPSLTMGTAASGRPSGRNGGVWSGSSRKSANRYLSEDNRPSSSSATLAPSFTCVSLSRLRRHGLLRQPLLQPIDVLEQAGAHQFQEIEAESRILHIELLDLVVGDAQDRPAFDALKRL